MKDSFWEDLDAFVPVLANYLTETRATQQAKQAQYYADISSISVSLKRIVESVDCDCVENPELIYEEVSKKKFEGLF